MLMSTILTIIYFRVFSSTQMIFSTRYALITKTMMLVFFYAYLIPLGVFVALGGLCVLYWVEKILLLRRDSKP